MNEFDVAILKEIVGFCKAIEFRIEKYSITEESYIDNDEFQDMLLMPIFQIGELSNTISEDLKLEHAEIPWQEMTGFRNIIAHDYGVVDPVWTWNTITIDIPNLKNQVENLLA